MILNNRCGRLTHLAPQAGRGRSKRIAKGYPAAAFAFAGATLTASLP